MSTQVLLAPVAVRNRLTVRYHVAVLTLGIDEMIDSTGRQ